MTRLFIAVWPSDTVQHALAALVRDLPTDEPGVRLVRAENRHITLRFVGDADPDPVVDVLGSAVLPVATTTFGPAVERLGGRQFVLRVKGVDDLAAAVRAATADIGESDRRRFYGHLTLARTKAGARSSLLGRTFRAEMPVDEVALVASTLAPTGAEYETLARFPTHQGFG